MSDRPVCSICNERKARTKGWRINKASKTRVYDYKCGTCHSKRLIGNPNGNSKLRKRIPLAEMIAKQKLPGHERKLKRLRQEIASLRCVVREYRRMNTAVRLYKERQLERAANKHYGSQRYKRYRKDHCEECWFVPKHIAQLEVDHIDGNRANNDPSNLKTMCANCHRLKTMLNGDHLPKSATNAEASGQAILMDACLTRQ